MPTYLNKPRLNRDIILAATLGSLLATSAEAAPSVFVPAADAAAKDNWYQRKMVARILGRSVGKTSLEHINAYLKDHVLYDAYTVCTVEPVEADTYVGLDKPTNQSGLHF